MSSTTEMNVCSELLMKINIKDGYFIVQNESPIKPLNVNLPLNSGTLSKK